MIGRVAVIVVVVKVAVIIVVIVITVEVEKVVEAVVIATGRAEGCNNCNSSTHEIVTTE